MFYKIRATITLEKLRFNVEQKIKNFELEKQSKFVELITNSNI